MVTTDLSQCLISNKDGIVSSFLDLIKEQNGDLEKCRIAKLERLEKDIMRVHFLLEPGSIQVIKDIPSTLPFFLPDKGWSAFSPDKCKERYGCKVTKLNCRDIIYFKKEENVPSGPNRGSLHQRMKSTMFDDSDFCRTNLIYPECTPLVCQDKESVPFVDEHDRSDMTKNKHNLMDHILNVNKADKQFVRQSKREEGHARREEIMMNRKMKRSIPGDFRSSVEAGRTPKHSIKPIREVKELNIEQTSDNQSSEESEEEISDENNETTTDNNNTIYPNNNTPIKNHFNQSFYPISKELFPSDNDALLWYLTKSPATPVYRRVISKQPQSVITVVKTAKIPAFCSKTDSFPLLSSNNEEDETITSPGNVTNAKIVELAVNYLDKSGTTIGACPKINLLERFNQHNEDKRGEVKRSVVSSNKMSFRLNPNNKECNATHNSINALRMSMTHGNVP